MSARRKVVYLDVETTGTDPWKDRVVEASFLLVPRGEEPRATPWTFRCKPPIPISPGATEVHGITDDDLDQLPGFDFHAEEVQALLDGAVLVGYNIRKFDSILLDRELRMAGQPGLERDAESGKITQPEVDLLALWHLVEPRTLEGALLRFLGMIPGDFEAHGAEDDVGVLPGLLAAMEAEFFGDREEPQDWEELAAMCVPEGEMDRAGKFTMDEEGVLRIAFGQHSGTAWNRIPKDYLEWMMRPSNDFAPDTLAIVRRVLVKREELARRRRRK